MDSLIYGSSKERNIVAVQMQSDSSVRIYKRTGDRISHKDEEFFPFFHLSDPALIAGFSKSFWLKKLSGGNFYSCVCAFPRIQDMWDAVHFVLERISQIENRRIESHTQAQQILLRPDGTTQYYLQSGKTSMKGMEYQDLYRMQIDIETYSKDHRFSNSSRTEDRIILIALSDNRGWEIVLGDKAIPEAMLLKQFIQVVREKDPDVLEGHNIFNFDLPYIIKRCELHKIDLRLGRDGSTPRGSKSRTSFVDQEVEYTSFEIAGRHVVDTWLLVQSYDMTRRILENYSLKTVARHFGIAGPERVVIPGDRISQTWDNEPELLRRYALDDVRETRAVSDHLSVSNFFLAQMLPFNYGTLAKLGSAAKIESLLLREYLHQRHSLPKPQIGVQTTGGFTEVFYTGVLGPVVHADVESLYPSIMISKEIFPATDELRVFSIALKHLTRMRLDTKKEMKEEQEPALRSRLDAMQSSFKILINSFYGYLGYSRGLFNDYEKAELVTKSGQEILRSMIRDIDLYNGTVIEVDTDGVYFTPPDNVTHEQTERKLVERLGTQLGEGIHLEYSGRYRKILSYKKKNYALLGYDDKITLKGSSLISRSMERIGRSYVQQCIDCILNSRIDDLHKLFRQLEQSFRDHALDVRDFARTETLRDSLQQYTRDVENGKRNHSAAYELALKSSRGYREGDKVTYYIIGNEANVRTFENAKEAEDWDANFPDENTQYYLKRLEEYSSKFEPFFSEKDFRAIFSSSEDLFGFDPNQIRILPPQRAVPEQRDEDLPSQGSSISLDI